MPAKSFAAEFESVARGPARGLKVTKLAREARPSNRKGALGKRVASIREIVREVAGLAPYEKRVMDIIKLGSGNVEKRAYKFAKKRLGSHKRAIAKREELKGVYAKMRARGSV